MKTRITISLTELAITILYIALCTAFNGSLPHSLSCTSYLIPHDYDFSIYVATVAIFAATTLFQGCDRKEKNMVWLMIIGLIDVALSPHYHTSNTFLHYFGGILCCVASVIYVSHRAPKLLYLWIPCFVACTIYPPSHILFEEFTCVLEMVILNLIPRWDLMPHHAH